MLTVEILRQSTALVGLTDEQLTAVAEMSRNDEVSVIGTRIGELHGRYDADVLGVSGVKKNDGEKSYDYVKRVLNENKTRIDAAASLQQDLSAQKAKVSELTSKIAENSGDAVLKQQLKDAKSQVTQLQTQLQTVQTDFDTAKATHETGMKDVHANYAFEAATAGIKFKAGIPESIKSTLLSSAKAEIMQKGSLDIIEANGIKTVVVRGADGNILNNPKNNLNPYTISELVLETSLKDVIDTGKQQAGGGTGNLVVAPGGSILDLSAMKSQVEADRAIEAHLLVNGLTRDSSEFAEQSLSLRAEANVASLPIK